MKTLVKNYTFVPATREITITNLAEIKLEQLLIITNVENNTMIYNFANPVLGASVAGNVITLDYNTASMSASDRLQIFIDIDNHTDLEVLGNVIIDGFASVVSQLESMKTAQGQPDVNGRSRVVIESGTLPTVSTVSTVGSTTLMDGYFQRMMLFNLSNGSVNALRSKINIYGGSI